MLSGMFTRDALAISLADFFSVFLAVKYAPAAMAKTNPSGGKTLPGGSMILTASGKLQRVHSLSLPAS